MAITSPANRRGSRSICRIEARPGPLGTGSGQLRAPTERNFAPASSQQPASGNNQGTLLIDDNATDVRIRCPACGAEQTLHSEPRDGQWLPCHTCQDWSPLELPSARAAGPTFTRSLATPAGPVEIEFHPAGWNVARTHLDIPFKLADADVRALCERADAIHGA
jgi:hypothetical protein